MRQSILSGNQPYPNPTALAPCSLGAYMWREGFTQDKATIQADLVGFVNHLSEATGTAAMVNVTDIEGLFDAICRAEEPMVMYSGIGTDALEGHTLAFVGDMVNGQLPLLFSLTTGVSVTAAKRTLGLIRGAVVLSLTPLVEHYVALGTADGL
eukprot:705030-Ditylum_brightwellii.AAC.1